MIGRTRTELESILISREAVKLVDEKSGELFRIVAAETIDDDGLFRMPRDDVEDLVAYTVAGNDPVNQVRPVEISYQNIRIIKA